MSTSLSQIHSSVFWNLWRPPLSPLSICLFTGPAMNNAHHVPGTILDSRGRKGKKKKIPTQRTKALVRNVLQPVVAGGSLTSVRDETEFWTGEKGISGRGNGMLPLLRKTQLQETKSFGYPKLQKARGWVYDKDTGVWQAGAGREPDLRKRQGAARAISPSCLWLCRLPSFWSSCWLLTTCPRPFNACLWGPAVPGNNPRSRELAC